MKSPVVVARGRIPVSGWGSVVTANFRELSPNEVRRIPHGRSSENMASTRSACLGAAVPQRRSDGYYEEVREV
jgi:hypothetical protein